MNQRIELFSFLNDNAFHNERKRVEFVFDFFGINVLSACTEKHILAATTDEEVAFCIENTQISCVIPAFSVERLGCGFRIFVITEHHVGATRQNFTYNASGVGTVDADFHTRSGFTTRTWYEVFPILIGDDGSAFCGTITHGVVEADFVEELFHFFVERRTPNDDFVEFSTKHLLDGRTHFGQDAIADDGQAQK